MPNPNVSDTALDQYDLTPPVRLFPLPAQGNSNAVIGVGTGAGEFVLKVHSGYDDPRRLDGEHTLLAWRREQDMSFTVPAPLPTRMAWSRLGWQALAPLIPGARVDPADEHELESFGGALGELLAALERYPGEVVQPPTSEFQVIVPHLPDLSLDVAAIGLDSTRATRDLLTWLEEELADLRGFVGSAYQELPRQLTHNDFIPSNVLALHGQVTAVLDFEFATHGIRALDFSMALLFCLRYRMNPEPHRTAMLLSRGYGRANTLSGPEIEALPRLLRLRNMASTRDGWDVPCARAMVAPNSFESSGPGSSPGGWSGGHPT